MKCTAPYAEMKRYEIEIAKLTKLLDFYTNSVHCATWQQHEREVTELFQRIRECRRPLLKLRYIEALNKQLTKMNVCIGCEDDQNRCAECQLINQIRLKLVQILTKFSTSLLEQVIF